MNLFDRNVRASPELLLISSSFGLRAVPTWTPVVSWNPVPSEHAVLAHKIYWQLQFDEYVSIHTFFQSKIIQTIGEFQGIFVKALLSFQLFVIFQGTNRKKEVS